MASIATLGGLEIATDYVRIVRGGRGEFVEFRDEYIKKENIHIPDEAKWRHDDYWKTKVFFLEYRSNCSAYVKLYYQMRKVWYADYVPGMWYIHPSKLLYMGTK